MAKIIKVVGRQVFDSRGNPTVEAEVFLNNKTKASAIVPSGASTGAFEAYELRDDNKNYFLGKSVLNALKNINTIINKNLKRNMPACIIYTSGTSGNPKGVILSHGGILSNCEGAVELLKPLTEKKDPIFLTWLPLSHSYEHTVQFIQIILGAEVFYAESLEKLIQNILLFKPTIMTAVPIPSLITI